MRILLVVIDSATPRVVCPAIQTGRLPTLRRLMEAGTMHQESVSIFPSITPAATTSIATGAYPAEHGIIGASWYEPDRNEVAYYGDDFWVIAREGFGTFLRDFLLKLNGDRLRAPTLFELVERSGRAAACVNYLLFRGLHEHRVNVPWLLSLLPGVPFTETVQGPSVLFLGDFVQTWRGHKRRKRKREQGLLHRFGMDDASTARFLGEIAEERGFPDLTIAYFPDTDFRSHNVGPHDALPTVERVDAALADMFDRAGGLTRFLDDSCVIVTSDHGHCEVLDDTEQATIHLDDELEGLRQAKLGRPWRKSDQIMICPNLRTAQIYVREPTKDLVERIAGMALRNPRIDQVIWRTRLTRRAGRGATVATARGRLEFWAGTDGPESGRDAFGTTWSWRGNSEALALEKDGGRVESRDYPNAFERIVGALAAPHSGELWITARPGYEFAVPGTTTHVGGASHGALHALDSFSPLIMAGGSARRRLPRHLRSVDIAPLCMELLGIPMRYAVGDPRRPTRS